MNRVIFYLAAILAVACAATYEVLPAETTNVEQTALVAAPETGHVRQKRLLLGLAAAKLGGLALGGAALGKAALVGGAVGLAGLGAAGLGAAGLGFGAYKSFYGGPRYFSHYYPSYGGYGGGYRYGFGYGYGGGYGGY